MNKPDTEFIIEQAMDLKKSVDNGLVVDNIRTANPIYGLKKDVSATISVLDLFMFIKKSHDDGMIGLTNGTKLVLGALQDVNNHIGLQRERLRDYWRKMSDSIEQLTRYIKFLEDKMQSSEDNESELKRLKDELDKSREEINMIKRKYGFIINGGKYFDDKMEKLKTELKIKHSGKSDDVDEIIDNTKSEVHKVLDAQAALMNEMSLRYESDKLEKELVKEAVVIEEPKEAESTILENKKKRVKNVSDVF